MTNNTILNDAVNRIGDRIGNDLATQAVVARILNSIDSAIVPTLMENKLSTQSLLSNTDSEFLEDLLFRLRIKSSTSGREAEKFRRIEESTNRFFKKINDNGGLLKVGEVASILGVSRQAIAKQRDKLKLIFIRVDHDFHYPRFQFKEGKKIAHLEEVLGKFPEPIKGVSQVSFFLNQLEMPDGQLLTPLEILTSCEINMEHVEWVKQQAYLLGRHMAK